MKKHNVLSSMIKIAVIFLIVFMFGLSGLAGQEAQKSSTKVHKVETGYWVIKAMTVFNAKANAIVFHHPNSGTKKVGEDEQVLGVQFALHNPSDKEIKVRRNDFHVNGTDINHFIVKEKTTQPLVVKVPPGKAIGITNYYIVGGQLSGLKDLKVIYTSVDKAYKKIEIGIPLFQDKN